MHHSSGKYWQIKNAISQALTKPQEVTPPNPTIDSRTFGTNHTPNCSCEINRISSWSTNDYGMPPQSNNYHSQTPYETPTSSNAYIIQQLLNQIPFDYNQPLVKLLRCQSKLTHSTQWLHQKNYDALENIAESSPFQENQHFISDIPIIKVKDPQSFDDWLEQIGKVASLTNKDPY